MSYKTFDGGIHPSYHKEMTSGAKIERAAHPKRVIIPLQQHIGAPCTPIVRKKDMVEEGEKIGEAVGFVSAPVHASVSGKVKEVDFHPHPGGGSVLSVVIDADGPRKEWEAADQRLKIEGLSVESIREKLREAGIVGMGGATFPTAVKLSPPAKSKVDTVIINGCECEPYLTSDHRLMVEAPEKVLLGLKAIMKTLGAVTAIIGVEDNKPDAIAALREAASVLDFNVNVVPLGTKYPQGAEKMLVKVLLGRIISVGKLPFQVGVVVNNVGTSVAVYEALKLGKPLIERVVTISGNGVARPGNLLVTIGTTFEEVIDQCGGFIGEGERVVLAGGPMMGVAQTSLGVPVVKGTSGITVLVADEIKPAQFGPCIRCAGCVQACPMGLMPFRLADMGRLSMVSDFNGWGGLSCIECGCCSYACPADRPLVQWIRVGKVKLRESERSTSA